MGKDTGIAWTHHTFNPWWGCMKISPGCTNCYAATWDRRMGGAHWGPVAPRRFFGDKHWREPLAWAKAAAKAGERRRVFCASMADVFEDREDLVAWRGRLFELIKATPELDWLLLTKRIASAVFMLPWFVSAPASTVDIGGRQALEVRWDRIRWDAPWPNVWIGTTVEDRERALARIPVLAKIPAAVRFLSMEPLLEETSPAEAAKLTTGHPLRECVDWIIGGCESGDDKRPASARWFRRLRDECAPEGVAFFLKQATPEHGTAVYPGTGAHRPVIIGGGPGARAKRDGVLEAPYLDGRQHLAVPTPRAVA